MSLVTVKVLEFRVENFLDCVVAEIQNKTEGTVVETKLVGLKWILTVKKFF